MHAGSIILSVTLLASLQGTQVNAKHNSNDKIIFPGLTQEHNTETRYGSVDNDVPEQCKNKNYCTIKPKNYPQEKFDKMIGHKIPVDQPDVEIDDLADKQGDPDEIDNCEIVIEFEPLYKVKSKDGEWRNVVQSVDKNYVQKVRLETCKEKGASCFTIFPKMPNYTTFCKQKFTTWHFVVEAADGSNKEEKMSVDLPTCCSCHYKDT